MLDQYRLRLRDGTILAVDHDGLRTWVLDDKAMVQPAGTRGWRPLRETLALLERQRAAADVRRPEPAPPEPSPREAPSVALPLVPPPPRVEVALPLVPPPPRVEIALPLVPPPPRVEVALPLVPPPPRRDVSNSPAPILPTAQHLTNIADSIAPESARSPESSVPQLIPLSLEALPIIPFKALEPEEEAFYVPNAPPDVEVEDREDERVESAPAAHSLLDVASAEVDRHAREERPWQWAPPEPRDLPGVGSLQRIPFKKDSDEDLEELEELELLEEDPGVAPLTGPMALREMFSWVGPLASSWRDQALRRAHLTPHRLKRGLLITAAVAAAVVAVATVSSMWVSGRMSSGASTAQAIPVPPPPAREVAPELPKAVQAVMDQAPHLAPDTIRLLLSTSTSYGVPEASEVFRRAYRAAERGTGSLTQEEAHELRGLTKSVLAVLGPGDRKRVLAYGRLSTGRNLLASEDRRVLELFARGVRTLPTTHRERLQALTGKAIAAAVTPPKS